MATACVAVLCATGYGGDSAAKSSTAGCHLVFGMNINGVPSAISKKYKRAITATPPKAILKDDGTPSPDYIVKVRSKSYHVALCYGVYRIWTSKFGDAITHKGPPHRFKMTSTRGQFTVKHLQGSVTLRVYARDR